MYVQTAPLERPRPFADREGVSYDLHGIVHVRLVDARPGDAAIVAPQLAAFRGQPDSDPDLTIRFVDRLPVSGPLRHVTWEEAAYTDNAFLVLRSRHKSAVRVQIPMANIGRGCEIVCERGLPAVPLLVPILNLLALVKGGVAVYGSAFIYQGLGVLATSWSKGGRTEAALAFGARGADYVGEKWVYLFDDGRRLGGLPEPIRVSNWHLRESIWCRRGIGLGERAGLRAIEWAAAVSGATAGLMRRGGMPGALPRRIQAVLERQAFVNLPPESLFGAEHCSLSGPFDRLLFLVAHDSPEIIVRRIDPLEVARRMTASLRYERSPLLDHYAMFRFAFPELVNPLIEQVERLERGLLERAFAGRPAYLVAHPYPVSLTALFEAIEPALLANQVVS